MKTMILNDYLIPHDVERIGAYSDEYARNFTCPNMTPDRIAVRVDGVWYAMATTDGRGCLPDPSDTLDGMFSADDIEVNSCDPACPHEMVSSLFAEIHIATRQIEAYRLICEFLGIETEDLYDADNPYTREYFDECDDDWDEFAELLKQWGPSGE